MSLHGYWHKDLVKILYQNLTHSNKMKYLRILTYRSLNVNLWREVFILQVSFIKL